MKERTIFTQMKEFFARRHPSAFLLASQLLQIILYAIYDGQHNQPALLSAFGTLVLVLVVWVVSRSSAADWIAWALAGLAIILIAVSLISSNEELLVWSALLESALYFYAAGSLIVYMMGDYEVTTDELYAAGATFTLLAWGFGYAYLVCQAWVPNSFISLGNDGHSLTFIEALFLSFTNLSATGLGDILPVSAPARVLAMLGQFSGVGYITLVVSRLIGMTIKGKKDKKKGEIS